MNRSIISLAEDIACHAGWYAHYGNDRSLSIGMRKWSHGSLPRGMKWIHWIIPSMDIYIIDGSTTRRDRKVLLARINWRVNKVMEMIYPYEKIALIIYKHAKRRNKAYHTVRELFNLLMRETTLNPLTIRKKIDKLVKLGWIKPQFNPNPIISKNSRLILGYYVRLRIIEYELKKRGWLK